MTFYMEIKRRSIGHIVSRVYYKIEKYIIFNLFTSYNEKNKENF